MSSRSLNETPRVWLSTHMDTVPPFIAPTEDDEKIYGRGSCDAKGIVAAQITAAELLREQRIEDIGLLYTVEEERASTGAKVANDHPLAAKCEYLINGEPTDNDLAIGSKGAFRAKIKTTGRAAHAAYPEQGESAIEKLLHILEDVRHTKLPNDEFFGETTVNLATLDGGIALNVIPPNAECGIKQEPQLRDIMRIELKKIIGDEDFNIYMDPRINFYEKYGQKDLPTSNAILEKMINASQIEIDEMVKWTYGTLLIIFIVAWVLIGYLGSVEAITIITIDSILLLILGVNLPMIDIEAVLNAFTINRLGTNVGFERQYMYYQSKSILDVTQTLIKGGGLDLKIVGWMVLCFSVVFPFIKLVLSGFYLYSDRVRNNKWVQNIIFYLGKWSMADVFVVALFMAYIGFYGIISSQLNSIANNKGGFAVETINNSGLAPGALFFTAYCILSIIVGTLIS